MFAYFILSDARPIGGQEVAGATPAKSATFFRGDLIMKYFFRVVSFWQMNVGYQFLAKECAQ